MEKQSEWWKERRAFVTGATGIVGSWVVKDLVDRGAYVVALVLDPDPQSEFFHSGYYEQVHIVNGALEDFRSLERAILAHECDSVVHLGAQAIVSVAQRAPLATFEANVRGTWNVLEVCRLHSDLIRQVVVASSDKAYGEHEALPYTEDMPLQGRQPYEASKSCADMISQSYYAAYGVPVAIARCGNIYGGGDLNWTRIVPSAIRSFYNKESPVLRSDGQFIRDYIYVEDVSSAYLTLLGALHSAGVAGEAFNFSPESRVTVLELVAKIARLMRCEHIRPKVLNSAKGEIRNQYLSSDKAARVLNWKATFTLEEGLEKTIRWYQNFLERGDHDARCRNLPVATNPRR